MIFIKQSQKLQQYFPTHQITSHSQQIILQQCDSEFVLLLFVFSFYFKQNLHNIIMSHNQAKQLGEFSKQICFMTGFQNYQQNKSSIRYSEQIFPQPWTDQIYPMAKTNLSCFLEIPHLQQKKVKKSIKILTNSKSYQKSKSLSKQANNNSPFKTIYPEFQETNTFSLTVEQKQKINLQKIAHQKHNKKFSKLLKMRSSFYQKIHLNSQQKSNDQTFREQQILIQDLEKFSSDNILKKSIDRAIQVLRKRTNFNYRKHRNINPNVNVNSQRLSSQQLLKSIQISKTFEQNQANSNNILKVLEFTQTNHRKTKSFSLAEVANSKQKQKSPQRLANNYLSNISVHILTKKQTDHNEAKTNSKIIFKPKRNWINMNMNIKKTAQNDIILHRDNALKIKSVSKQKALAKIQKLKELHKKN